MLQTLHSALPLAEDDEDIRNTALKLGASERMLVLPHKREGCLERVQRLLQSRRFGVELADRSKGITETCLVDRAFERKPPGLKVRDEIRAGNPATEGAKNVGRFEAFFLPAAEWERVREDFWERTGFAADPGQATEQLKARLTQALDGFLKGVSDNLQVTFDEEGWRLKSDQTERLEPGRA